jgi:methionine-rich copper-binding protein CopC
MMRTVRVLAAMGVAALAAVVVMPNLASAHARYKSSIPGKGEVVTVVPAQVEITFTEDIQKVSGSYSMTVTDSKGAIASTGLAVIDEQDRSRMSVPVASNLPPGRYVVHWSNVSDGDGDPLSGEFSFYVQTQPTADDLAADAALATAEAPEPEQTAASGDATSTQPPSFQAASPTAVTTPASGGGGGSNTGLIVGVVVVIAVVVVAGGGGYLYWRGRKGS